jgi:hypothetical protein
VIDKGLKNIVDLLEEQVYNTNEDLLDYVAATFTEVTLEDDEEEENEDTRHL